MGIKIKIDTRPRVSEKQYEILVVLRDNGPMTRRQVAEHLKNEGLENYFDQAKWGLPNRMNPYFCKRFSDLEKKRLIGASRWVLVTINGRKYKTLEWAAVENKHVKVRGADE